MCGPGGLLKSVLLHQVFVPMKFSLLKSDLCNFINTREKNEEDMLLLLNLSRTMFKENEIERFFLCPSMQRAMRPFEFDLN